MRPARTIDLTQIDFDTFWRRVDKTDSCWNWTGAKNGQGYGSYFVKERAFMTHRISYLLHNGSLDNNICVCHSCDNRLCVNPKHLFLASLAENNKDRDSKGRQVKGSKIFWSKYTEEDVLVIRALYHWSKFTITEISREYKDYPSAINNIVKNRTWKSVRTIF